MLAAIALLVVRIGRTLKKGKGVFLQQTGAKDGQNSDPFPGGHLQSHYDRNRQDEDEQIQKDIESALN